MRPLVELLAEMRQNLAGGQLLPLKDILPEERELAKEVNIILAKWLKDLEELELTKATFANILHSLPQGIFWKDLDSVFLGCNKTFSKSIGYSSPERLVGKTDYDILEAEKAFQHRKNDLKVLETLKTQTSEPGFSELLQIYTRTTKAPLSTPDGQVFGILGITEDITDRKIAENETKLSERKFRLLAESVSDVIWMMDQNLKLTYINPAITRHTGFTTEEALTLSIDQRYPPATLKIMRELNSSENRRKATEFSLDVEIYRKDGSTFWAYVRFRVVRDENNIFKGIIGITTDITTRKRNENELKRLAITDVMTGAFNKTHFVDAVQEAIIQARKYGTPFSLLMFDIDRFKDINDTYGHPIGDQIIIELCNMCMETQRKGDVLGRLGGDEFGLLLPNIQVNDALLAAERIRQKVKMSEVMINSQRIPFSISLGATQFWPEDTADGVLERVDQALYEAKRLGRDRAVSK